MKKLPIGQASMQNFDTNQKPKHTIRNVLLAVVGTGVLIFLILFVTQVLSIRSQILTGAYNFDEYGLSISGAGGANYDQSGGYNVATTDDPSIGPADAVVTIVEFGDFECPFCRRSFPTIRALAEEFNQDVRYIYRDFPIESIHPNARVAALAGYCATKQGLFWPLHDKMFQNQETLSQTAILGYANQVGIDSQSFASCLGSQEASAEVNQDIADGQAAGVLGTPTWFINGIRLAGVIPEEVFREIINELVARER